MARKCLPGWLDSYMEYTSEQESPKAFHQWVALGVVGAAIGRNIWIPRVMYTIFPNLFIVLVAGSAKCRKSVSLGIGEKMLKSLKDPPMVFSQKITAEALIQSLQESEKDGVCYGVILASELSVFMGHDAIRSGIIPILTDLYDSKDNWEYKTRSRGKEKLQHVTISMLAASTKDWIKTSIPVEAIGGGFTSRVIFVFEDAPSKLVLFSDNVEKNAEVKLRLTHDLEEIRKLKGKIEFSPQARDLAMDWYTQEASNIRDEKVDGYYGRKHDTIFKVSTILCIAEKDELLVERRHIQKAMDMLERNEGSLTPTLETVASSISGGNTEKVLQVIKRFGEISHSNLLKKCWRYASATEFNEMMKTLLDSGEIDFFLDQNNTKVYKRKEVK